MADHRFDGEYVYEGILLEESVSKENVEKVRNFSTQHDDILIASYPKTGTTWMSELVSVLTAGGNTKEVSSKNYMERVFFLEMKLPIAGLFKSGLELLEDAERPALLKTHLPGWFLNKPVNAGLKTIVMIRNPKDTLVSFHNFYKTHPLLGKFSGTFDDFFELYKTKHLVYGDFFDWYESWLPHLNKPNVLLVSFEEMKQDIQGVINRVSKFIGKKIGEDKMSSIIDHTSIESMRANQMLSSEDLMSAMDFFRKGKVGDWKNHFSPEQSHHIDEMYRDRLESKGIKLHFELDAGEIAMNNETTYT